MIPIHDLIRQAGFWFDWRPPVHDWVTRLIHVPVLFQWTKVPRGLSILHVGCGTGKLAQYLAQRLNPKAYTAIDLNPVNISEAESASSPKSKVIFQVADVCRLPFDNESFELVLEFDVLHHVSDWKKAVREIKRVLKPKGRFLMKDLSIETFSQPGIGIVMQRLFEHSYDLMFDQVEFLTYLKKNGFTITHQNDNPFHIVLVAVKNSR